MFTGEVKGTSNTFVFLLLFMLLFPNLLGKYFISLVTKEIFIPDFYRILNEI
jgi:hypothetical protein